MIIIGIGCALITALGIIRYNNSVRSIHNTISTDISSRRLIINVPTKKVNLGEGLVVEIRTSPLGKFSYSSRNRIGSKEITWEEDRLDGEIYDITNNEWKTLPKANLTSRVLVSTHLTGRKLLIWGGRTYSNEFLNDGVIYDIDTLQCEKLPKPPIEGRIHPTIVDNGSKIILFGGRKDKYCSAARADQQVCFSNDIKYDKSMYCNDGAIYDIDTNRWQKLPECPIEGREYYAHIWHNSKLLILGGYLCEGAYPPKETYFKDGAIYDADKNQWQKIPDYPGAGDGGYYNTILKGSEVIVLGKDDNAIFDLDNNKWTDVAKRPFTCALDAVELIPLNNPTILFNWNDEELRGTIYNFQTNEWKEISKCPLEPRIYYQYIHKDSKLIIWAGHKDPDGIWSGHDHKAAKRKFFNDGAVYDFQADEWIKMAESPLEVQDRYHPINIIKGDKLFFCGGQKGIIRKCEETKYYSDGAIYDLNTNSWQKLSDVSIIQEPCFIREWNNSELIIVR